MKLFKIHYLIILIGVSLIIALSLDYISSSFGLETRLVQYVDKTGKAISQTVLDYPVNKRIISLLSTFFYGLTFSIFISGFVAKYIEKSYREKSDENLKKLINSVNIEVFNALFQILMPKKLFGVIKSQIIENKIIRRDAKWNYDFTINQQGKIQLVQTLRYEVQNLSRESVNNPFSIIIRNEDNIQQSLETLLCQLKSVQVALFNKNHPENNQAIQTIENGRHKITHIVTYILPSRGVFDVTARILSTYDNEVHDEYITARPLIDAELTVTFPLGYTFSLLQFCSNEFRKVLEDNTRHIYKLKGALLPHQGFVFLLKRNPQ
jgi:hypothetical protein